MEILTSDDLVKALRARSRSGVNAAAASMLEHRLPMGPEWFSIAKVLVSTGEVTLAVEAARRGVEEVGSTAAAQLELAHILASVGRQDEALTLASTLPPGDVDPVDRDHLRGGSAVVLGDFDLARTIFEELVAKWPGAGPTWLSLAGLPATDDDQLLERVDQAQQAVAVTPVDYRAAWHYARGVLLDRLGRHDDAFAAFAEGAGLMHALRPYDRAADAADAVGIAADFSRRGIDEIAAGVTQGSARPIFVIGLPRSGTTLVEQILAAHSDVAGGDEVRFAAILAQEVGGRSLPQLTAFASTHGADALTSLYLHLGDERFGDGRFIDKNISNSRALGMLAAILPDAPIIWIRRDPLDCAWSCFRTYFTRTIDWSWSLEDIGAHFAAEDRLYAHWQEVLGDRILSLTYEELTADPAAQASRILAHAGLANEPAVTRTHKTKRSVSTASAAQVRQPVYRTSVGAADKYRAHLQPFIDAYAASALSGTSSS